MSSSKLTYSEQEGESPFNWYEHLEMMRKLKEKREADPVNEAIYNEYSIWHSFLVRKASDWTTCACGNQDARIPRHDETGSPIDLQLRELGIRFYTRIDHEKWETAKLILDQIEERAGKVMKVDYDNRPQEYIDFIRESNYRATQKDD